MAAVLRVGGLRVTIYPNDHPPPHVHVIGVKGEAVFWLNCPNGPADLPESYGFNGPEIRERRARWTSFVTPDPRIRLTGIPCYDGRHGQSDTLPDPTLLQPGGNEGRRIRVLARAAGA